MRRLLTVAMVLLVPALSMAQDEAPAGGEAPQEQQAPADAAAPAADAAEPQDETPAAEAAADEPPKKLVIGALEETPGPVPKEAPEKKGKSQAWERLRLGSNLQFMSTFGEIESRSANTIVYRNIDINPAAIRYEPRVDSSGRITVSPLVSGQSLNFSVDNDFINDPRQDSGALQNNTVEETLWMSLNAAIDLKSWRHGTLFMQFDAGYFSGDVGPIEVAVDIAEQSILNPADQDLTADDPFANYQYIFPTAGTLTEVPLQLSAIWQFRPRSPFRPYLGLGVGYMFTDLSDSASLDRVNSQLRGIEYQWVSRGQLISEGTLGLDASGNETEIITAQSTSDYLWSAQGGLEYNVNRNWSVYFSATLIQTPASVQMATLGYTEFGVGIPRNDQVDDVEGIGSEDDLIRTLLALPVDQAVALIEDITDVSSIPSENERSYFTVYPVELGDPVTIELPNPVKPDEPTTISRQSKLFVQAGDFRLDSFSVGLGFRYRY